ncbi:hypothetical protein ABGV17_11175, partial [Guyparkeria sp. GHLCS8-2]|uniref:hypothetical protein n=2 Tax=Guyparkeria halopsychrophila TaxID=3139421 RepID=UPI0037C8A0C1
RPLSHHQQVQKRRHLMLKRTHVFALAAIIALTGGLTACGGPDAPESPTNPFNGTYKGNVFLDGYPLPADQPTPYMTIDGKTLRTWVGPDREHDRTDEFSYIKVETFKSGKPKKVAFYNEYDEAEWTFVSTRNGTGGIMGPDWSFGHYVPVDFDPDAIRARQEKEATLATERQKTVNKVVAFGNAWMEASDTCKARGLEATEDQSVDMEILRACLQKVDECEKAHKAEHDIEGFKSCFDD